MTKFRKPCFFGASTSATPDCEGYVKKTASGGSHYPRALAKPEWLTIGALSALIRVPPRTLYRLAKSKSLLAACQIGTRWRFHYPRLRA